MLTIPFHKILSGNGDADDTILVLYDGHHSHKSVDLVEWAKSCNIVLFVLPSHISYIISVPIHIKMYVSQAY